MKVVHANLCEDITSAKYYPKSTCITLRDFRAKEDTSGKGCAGFGGDERYESRYLEMWQKVKSRKQDALDCFGLGWTLRWISLAVLWILRVGTVNLILVLWNEVNLILDLQSNLVT